jgi:hypothetical protein
MRTAILIFFASALSCLSASGQCNTGFTASVNNAWVTATANSNTPGLWHAWTFGDGSGMKYGPAVTHQFIHPGTYVITHILRDSLSNCWDSTSQTVTASFSYTCTASFSYTLDSVTGRYTFTSTSSSSAPPSPSVESYQWTVDGVYKGSGPTFSTMLSPGSHNVCLKMSRPTCADSVCKTITVAAVPGCSMQASFTYSAEPGNPNRIRFSASPNLPNAFYYWNIGGSNYFTREVTHVYNGAGTYPVWLSVTDSTSRCSDSVFQYISVQPGPADSCVVSLAHQQNATYDNHVVFSAQSNQPIQFMHGFIEYPNGWGDSLVLNQQHILPDTGTYIIQLTVHTQSGCVKTVYDTVRVTGMASTNTVIPCYPNPATNRVTMQFRLPESLKMVISVHNTSGVEMKSMVQIGWQGNVVVSIPVDDLQPGQYFIQVVFPETHPIQRKSSIFQKL